MFVFLNETAKVKEKKEANFIYTKTTKRRKVASAAPDPLTSLVWAGKSEDASEWFTQKHFVCSKQQKRFKKNKRFSE